MAARVVQISDNHLSARHGFARPNWEATVAHLTELQPDLVISTGDIVVDDPDEADTRAFARECFDDLPCPWLVVPGNHDVGDGPPEPWQDQSVSPERVAAFVDAWGMDRFVYDTEGWRLIGINGLLMGSDLEDMEDEHDAWFVEQLDEAGDREIAVFTHKPPFIERVDETVGMMAMPARGRDRLLDLVDEHDVRVVASGHLHDFRARQQGEVSYIWCPTTAFIPPSDLVDPYGGVRQIGFVEYDFDADGVSWRLRRPEGAEDISVREISAEHGSIRWAPEHPW